MPAKKVAKPTAESASERSNKKAEVIAIMKRSKGATLAEIMEETCQTFRAVKPDLHPLSVPVQLETEKAFPQ